MLLYRVKRAGHREICISKIHLLAHSSCVCETTPLHYFQNSILGNAENLQYFEGILKHCLFARLDRKQSRSLFEGASSRSGISISTSFTRTPSRFRITPFFKDIENFTTETRVRTSPQRMISRTLTLVPVIALRINIMRYRRFLSLFRESRELSTQIPERYDPGRFRRRPLREASELPSSLISSPSA
jgi:hypothetical protein